MAEHKDREPDPGGDAPAREPAGPAARKPYQSPELVEYGPVAKLTQGTLSRNSDFFSGGFRMRNNMGMCL